jgi:hypothetical protein
MVLVHATVLWRHWLLPTARGPVKHASVPIWYQVYAHSVIGAMRKGLAWLLTHGRRPRAWSTRASLHETSATAVNQVAHPGMCIKFFASLIPGCWRAGSGV